MELYAILSLAGFGIWLNTQRKPAKVLKLSHDVASAASTTSAVTGSTAQLSTKNDDASMTDLYHSTYTHQAAGEEAAKTAFKYQQSRNPKSTSVINPATHGLELDTPMHDQQQHTQIHTQQHTQQQIQQQTQFSALAGVSIPVEEFTHNNMQPFYRGTNKNFVDPFLHSTSTRMEDLNGSSYLGVSKREVEATQFFVPQRDIGNVYGSANQTSQMRDFIVEPRARNNEFPIERVQVGPGIGSGFAAAPEDVYVAQRQYAMPKTTDEIRVANNPKVTHEGRTVDGIKVALGASSVGIVEKRTPETFKQNTCEDMLPTTGAVLKEQKRPDKIMLRDTSKPATHTAYAGGAYMRKGDVAISKPSGETHRQAFGAVNLGPAHAADFGRGAKDDYGKSTIKVFTTGREVIEAKARTGNFATAVKNIIAPLQDVMRTAKKETMVENARTYGNIQSYVPPKQTVYDPNVVARTTIKETTIQEAIAANLKPNVFKITVYDPSDVARTTLKETQLQSAPVGTLTTHRYKPTAALEDPAKATGRQTLDYVDTHMNLRSRETAGVAYDPTEVAKTTTKETVNIDGYETAHVGGLQGQVGGYTVAPADAKTTQKEMFSDEYYGSAKKPNADGAYVVTQMEAKQTQKQVLSDVEYFGNSADQSGQKPTSSDQYEAARVNEHREELLEGRVPTTEGPKAGTESTAMGDVVTQRQNLDVAAEEFQQIERTPLHAGHTGAETQICHTRERNHYPELDRLDRELLDQLEGNDIAMQPIASMP